jgi:hypothetical protein
MKMKMKIPSSERTKNFMIMKLLSYVPEFQRDVVKIRKEFEIRESGIEFEEIEAWAINKTISSYYEEGRGGLDVQSDFPSNVFEEKMRKLGIKYRLPLNFYGLPYRGIPYFILTGQIQSPEQNYFIDFHGKDDELPWASLNIYAALSAAESKAMAKELRELQIELVPTVFKGADIFARKRYRGNLHRDFSLYEEQITRSGKPKKVKKFNPGSYIDIVSKNKGCSKKELSRLERLHKNEIEVGYDNPTSKQIGKKRAVSGAATRQAKRRLHLLAESLFGYGLGRDVFL